MNDSPSFGRLRVVRLAGRGMTVPLALAMRTLVPSSRNRMAILVGLLQKKKRKNAKRKYEDERHDIVMLGHFFV
jgi:hypothetical protein